METRRFVNLVTVTRADDNTEPYDLLEIWNEFPFVEFGILLSYNHTLMGGCPRFPSLGWLDDLASFQDSCSVARQITFMSGHLCGRWVREILLGRSPSALDDLLITDIHQYLGRWQLNTHGNLHDFALPSLTELWGREHWLKGRQLIFQRDGVSSELCQAVRERAPDLDVAELHDLSGGAGIVPGAWEAPSPGLRTGYAGGLSPENVAAELERISRVVPEGQVVWIDAETHLRSGDGPRSRFDLKRVRAFLAAASPHVVQK